MSTRGAPRRPPARTLRWVVVAAVLAVALGVALWPRDAAEPTADADLAGPRGAAALDPCPEPLPGARPGGRLVGMRLPCLGTAGEVDLGAALAGRTVLVNVWASWCVPCREEIPALEAYRVTPGAVDVLGVSADTDPAAALAMMTAAGGRYPSVIDADVRLRRALAGPPLLPANYLVSPDGSVRRLDPPVVFRSAAQVHEVLAPYLARSG
ncbi:MAG: TlpA family protein disulfide reductase [Pseudonocardia sp.]